MKQSNTFKRLGTGVILTAFLVCCFFGMTLSLRPNYAWAEAPADSLNGGKPVIEMEKETDNSYMLNISSKTFHYLTCDSVSKMSEKNKKEYTGKREEIVKMGYKACGICRP